MEAIAHLPKSICMQYTVILVEGQMTQKGQGWNKERVKQKSKIGKSNSKRDNEKETMQVTLWLQSADFIQLPTKSNSFSV